ncbi:MAG TPA: c-type cytochrome domain-containing protein, partial [Bacteroidota bacterium]|nr:c-type cytochrome domain-containing protein [Bacteroidota bacterium]
MKKIIIIFLCLGGFSLLLWNAWSCKDTISGPGLSQIVFSSSPSYSKQVQPLFNQGCGGQNNACHGPETFASAGFSLDTYLHEITGNGVIVPGNANGSSLILTITGKSPPQMPPPG